MEAWRKEDEKYQKKTAGGVYFWSNNSRWGEVIDPKLYAKLPGYIQKSVVHLEARKTPDGMHAKIHYVNPNGKIEYYDEYGMADFMYGLKHTFGGKSDYGDMNDYEYEGGYSEGLELKKKGTQDREIEKWITINGKHIPVFKEG